MNASLLCRWMVCFFAVSLFLGIFCVDPSVTQEKPDAASLNAAPNEKQQPKIESGNQPEIFIEKTEHDAGDIYESSEAEHSFIVKNKGKGDLLINKVQPG